MLAHRILVRPITLRGSLVNDHHELASGGIFFAKHSAAQQRRACRVEVAWSHLTHGDQRIFAHALADMSLRTEEDEPYSTRKRQVTCSTRLLHVRQCFHALQDLPVEFRLFLWLRIASSGKVDRKGHQILRRKTRIDTYQTREAFH